MWVLLKRGDSLLVFPIFLTFHCCCGLTLPFSSNKLKRFSEVQVSVYVR